MTLTFQNHNTLLIHKNKLFITHLAYPFTTLLRHILFFKFYLILSIFYSIEMTAFEIHKWNWLSNNNPFIFITFKTHLAYSFTSLLRWIWFSSFSWSHRSPTRLRWQLFRFINENNSPTTFHHFCNLQKSSRLP